MIYPVRSRIVRRNPIFLGEQLENAAALMAADPGVSSLQAQLESAKSTLDMLLNNTFVVTYSEQVPRTRNRRTVTKTYTGRQAEGLSPRCSTSPLGGRNPDCSAAVQNAKRQIQEARARVADTEKRLTEAEQRVWDRISKAVPYKAYIIQPIIDRAANTIVYQLTKGGQPVGAPHQRLDEAKAMVDGEIAAAQEGAVKAWSDKRVAAEAAQVATSGSAVPVVAAQPAMPEGQPVAKSNIIPILAVGGAAVAALVLLK